MRSARNSTAQWLIVVLLAVIATALWLRPTASSGPFAFAQQQPLAGARGVFAFTGPLDNNSHGLFMLDVDQGTLWCYEIATTGGVRKLRLIAGRSWIYDRFLQDFNCAAPDFRMVQELVAQQRLQAANRPDASVGLGGEPAFDSAVPSTKKPPNND